MLAQFQIRNVADATFLNELLNLSSGTIEWHFIADGSPTGMFYVESGDALKCVVDEEGDFLYWLAELDI